MSFIANEDVTYQDQGFVRGEVERVDDTAQFVRVALEGNRTLKHIRPSWHTEDWVSFGYENYESLVVRADRNGILGGFMITPEGVRLMSIGASNLEGARLELAEAEPIPSRFELDK